MVGAAHRVFRADAAGSMAGEVEAMKVLCALAVAGLAALPACTEAGRKIASAEEAVRRVLKDPGSATFSDVTLGWFGSGVEGVCGKVNARNSFGGMSGPKPFAVSIHQGEAVVEAVGNGTAQRMCALFVPV